jgi:hypothetical protein
VDVIKLLVQFLKPEVDRRSSSTPAKVATKKLSPLDVPVDHCHLKVSGSSSSCQCGAVGRNRTQFGAPYAENHELARVPWRHRRELSVPPLSSAIVFSSSDPEPTATIRRADTPSIDLICVVNPSADGHSLMKLVDRSELRPWTRSTVP